MLIGLKLNPVHLSLGTSACPLGRPSTLSLPSVRYYYEQKSKTILAILELPLPLSLFHPRRSHRQHLTYPRNRIRKNDWNQSFLQKRLALVREDVRMYVSISCTRSTYTPRGAGWKSFLVPRS